MSDDGKRETILHADMRKPRRRPDGTYEKGHSPTTSRRPDVTRYLAVLAETVTPEVFKVLVERQVQRALSGNQSAFNQLCKLLGVDVQYIEQMTSGEMTVRVVYERRAPDRTA
jgi:hypothetical protein